MMRFWIDLGWLLDRFLVDFGPKLAAKLGPSWHQNSKNEGFEGHRSVKKPIETSKKIIQNTIDDKMEVGMDFGWLLD